MCKKWFRLRERLAKTARNKNRLEYLCVPQTWAGKVQSCKPWYDEFCNQYFLSLRLNEIWNSTTKSSRSGKSTEGTLLLTSARLFAPPKSDKNPNFPTQSDYSSHNLTVYQKNAVQWENTRINNGQPLIWLNGPHRASLANLTPKRNRWSPSNLEPVLQFPGISK